MEKILKYFDNGIGEISIEVRDLCNNILLYLFKKNISYYDKDGKLLYDKRYIVLNEKKTIWLFVDKLVLNKDCIAKTKENLIKNNLSTSEENLIDYAIALILEDSNFYCVDDVYECLSKYIDISKTDMVINFLDSDNILRIHNGQIDENDEIYRTEKTR